MSGTEQLGDLLEGLWLQLGPAPRSGLLVVDVPQRLVSGVLLLGVGREGRRLLVPLAPGDAPSAKEDRKGRAIQVRLIEFPGGQDSVPHLDVVCLEPQLNWIFTAFVVDVLLRMEPSDESPARLIARCLNGWRALFAGPMKRLGAEQLAGLYAELIVVDRMLAIEPNSIQRWRGPHGEPHDFVGAGVDLEVKATLSTQDDVVQIHGIRQLDTPPDVSLFLAHFRLDPVTASGESVPDVVSRLTPLDPHGALQQALLKLGYRDEDEGAYAAVKFEISQERWYAVDEKFPRLTEQTFAGAQVPAGLSGFMYSLDLSAVASPALTAARAEQTLKEICA